MLSKRMGIGAIMSAAAVIAAAPNVARATTITYTLNSVLSETGSPLHTGSPTVTFTDIGSNKVRIKMDMAGYSPASDGALSWHFNLDDAFSASNVLTMAYVSGVVPNAAPAFSTNATKSA